MATIISHTVVPLTIGLTLGSHWIPRRLLILGMVFAMLPDLDALAFQFGIPYASQFGHRGLTHSLFFAVCMAGLASLFYRQLGTTRRIVLTFAFIAMASHPLLDMMTNGGLGVALWWPFNVERIFLPWQCIEVSPIGSAFFSYRGLVVIQSKLLTVWLPALVFGIALYLLKGTTNNRLR